MNSFTTYKWDCLIPNPQPPQPMNPGTIVRIKAEWEGDSSLFIVIEWNGDRGFISPVEWNLGEIKPQELVTEEMIEEVKP